jgi:hypothetical protein
MSLSLSKSYLVLSTYGLVQPNSATAASQRRRRAWPRRAAGWARQPPPHLASCAHPPALAPAPRNSRPLPRPQPCAAGPGGSASRREWGGAPRARRPACTPAGRAAARAAAWKSARRGRSRSHCRCRSRTSPDPLGPPCVHWPPHSCALRPAPLTDPSTDASCMGSSEQPLPRCCARSHLLLSLGCWGLGVCGCHVCGRVPEGGAALRGRARTIGGG